MYLTSGRGCSEPDAELSVSQLPSSESKQFELDDGGLLRIVGIGAIIALIAGLIVGAIASFVMK